MRDTLGAALLMTVTASALLLAGPKFTSTWKAPGAGGTSFAGAKVAALVISNDESLRVSGEEALARELGARGMEGVAAYRLVPKEELRDPERAKGWFERAGVQGVVALRPVSAEKERTWTPSTWSSPYYGTLWGYYGYGWGAVYDPGYVREDTIVTVEALVFSVPRNALLWAGMSETANPKGLGKFVAELVAAAVKEMKKQGLVRPAAK